MFNSRPNFLVGGVQKGGTTSLYRYLTQHPHVLECERKEVGYFSDLYANGEDWYRSQFPSWRKRLKYSLRHGGWQRTGEATPYYLFHPHAAARVKAYCPDVRIIFLLRNPVDRAFSHHGYHVKLEQEALSFTEAIAAEPARLAGELEKMQADSSYNSHAYKVFSYLERGLYARQLERWFAHFPREQILVCSSEEFFADPRRVFEATQRFIGLPIRHLESYETFNPGKKRGVPEPLRSQLQAYFAPHNQQLFDLLGVDFGWDQPGG